MKKLKPLPKLPKDAAERPLLGRGTVTKIDSQLDWVDVYVKSDMSGIVNIFPLIMADAAAVRALRKRFARKRVLVRLELENA